VSKKRIEELLLEKTGAGAEAISNGTQGPES